MSWDLEIVRFASYPADEEATFADCQVLGTVAGVKATISQYIDVNWVCGNFWGCYCDDTVNMEINVGGIDSQDNEVIDSISVEIRGGNDPLRRVLQFSHPNQWAILDTATGQYIDPSNPSYQGWILFNHILGRHEI